MEEILQHLVSAERGASEAFYLDIGKQEAREHLLANLGALQLVHLLWRQHMAFCDLFQEIGLARRRFEAVVVHHSRLVVDDLSLFRKDRELLYHCLESRVVERGKLFQVVVDKLGQRQLAVGDAHVDLVEHCLCLGVDAVKELTKLTQ